MRAVQCEGGSLVRRSALALLAVAALAVAAAPPAQALGGIPAGGTTTTTTPPVEPATPTTPTTPTTSTTDTVSGPTTGSVGSCSVVASPTYLGLTCGSSSLGGLTPKKILGDDPVPDCWHDALTEAELAGIGLHDTAGPGGSAWYWERCLKGIDPETKQLEPGGIRFTNGIVSIRNGDPVKHLTDRQQDLVDMYGGESQVPSPVAVASPSVRPRVGAWVSFFNASRDTVVVAAGSAELRARVTSIDVRPLGRSDGPNLSCPGSGYRAQAGETREDHPSGCWYRYLQSSAGQDRVNSQGQPSYPVLITAHWAVDVVVGGVVTPFNTFTKSAETTVPVTEIQAIVVS